jgi:hypothetical protein
MSYLVLFVVHLVHTGRLHESAIKLLRVQLFNVVITNKLLFYAIKGLSLRDYA